MSENDKTSDLKPLLQITDWLGEDFDPECFNIDKVNKILKKIRK